MSPSAMRTARLGPLSSFLLLLPFLVVPVAWILFAQRLAGKWFLFGVLALGVTALVIVFRNSKRFQVVLLAVFVSLEVDIHTWPSCLWLCCTAAGYGRC